MTLGIEDGSTFAGYRIESVVARGGMGVVYRATDLSLDRPVALKLIAPELAQDEAFRRRFLKEPRLAAALDHPNVVPIYEAREHEGRLYLAMRFVPGEDLATRLGKHGGSLSPEEALAILTPVADALDAAHRRGLVHRDVKPANILVHEDGRPYLTDFGITKEVGSGSTATGQLVGTLAYVAPEGIRGEAIDGRSDQYALACVLHECLTGRPPFTARSEAELLWAHMQSDPPVPPEHPELGPVLARALAKAPRERYDSCTAFTEAARAVLLPGAVAPAATGGGARRTPRVRPLLLAGGGTLLLAGGVAAAVLVGADRSESPRGTGGGGQVLALEASTGRVERRIAAGRSPAAIAAGGDRLWVVDSEARTLLRIDRATGELETLATGATPLSVAADGGSVWVVNGRQRESLASLGAAPAEVARLDAATGIAESTVTLPESTGDVEGVFGDQLALSEHALWAVGAGGALVRIDRASHAVSAGPPHDGVLAVASGSAGVWVLREGNRAVQLDESSGRVLRRVRLPGEDVSSIAVGHDAAWAASYSEGRLWRIGAAADVLGSVALATGAGDIAASRSHVWVANPLAGTVSAVDSAAVRVERIVRVGGAPRSVEVQGDTVWVALTGQAAPASSEVEGVTPLPSSSCGPAVGGQSGRADALIVSDLPLRGDTRLTAGQMAQAITFVLREHGFRAGKLRLAYQSCDDALAATGFYDDAKCVGNGRAYAANHDVLAVIGTFHSGCAESMLPELNRARGGPLGMVSPLNSYVGLTRGDEVSRFYPTGKRNFVRVFPADDVQGSALAMLAHDRGRRVFVLEDDSEAYGGVIAAAFRQAAGTLGVEIAGRGRWGRGGSPAAVLARRAEASGADAVLLSGTGSEEGARVVRALRARLGPRVDLYAPDGFSPPTAVLEAAGTAARGMFISIPGTPVARLPPEGAAFVERFQRTQPGVPVESFAVHAAAATEVLLDALERSEGTRASVIEALFATRRRDGILGDLRFDERGDVVPAAETILRVVGGKESTNLASAAGGEIERVVRVPTNLLPRG